MVTCSVIDCGVNQRNNPGNYTFHRSDAIIKFLAGPDHMWYSRVADYIKHPESHSGISKTIALLELEHTDTSSKPICLPDPNSREDLTKNLYVLHYDRKEEFSIFAAEYLEVSKCNSIQTRTQAETKSEENTDETRRKNINGKPKDTQLNYTCARSVKMTPPHCHFPVGMPFITNITGPWTLLGLSKAEGSCTKAIPFFDIFYYSEWIINIIHKEPETTTILEYESDIVNSNSTPAPENAPATEKAPELDPAGSSADIKAEKKTNIS